jgi:hypothetical protein
MCCRCQRYVNSHSTSATCVQWPLQEQYKAVGDEVKAASLQAMKEQLSKFKASLEEFARKHKDDIRKDPVFRAQFHQMCANIGVDPLVSSKVRQMQSDTI